MLSQNIAYMHETTADPSLWHDETTGDSSQSNMGSRLLYCTGSVQRPLWFQEQQSGISEESKAVPWCLEFTGSSCGSKMVAFLSRSQQSPSVPSVLVLDTVKCREMV